MPSGVFDSSFLLCSFYSRGLELALFLVQELWAAWFLCMRVQGIKCSTRSRHPLSSAHEQQQQRGARWGTGLLIWRQAAAQGRPAGRSSCGARWRTARARPHGVTGLAASGAEGWSVASGACRTRCRGARRLPWPGAFALAGAGHLVEETVKFSSFVVSCLCDSCAGRRIECVCGKSRF